MWKINLIQLCCGGLTWAGRLRVYVSHSDSLCASLDETNSSSPVVMAQYLFHEWTSVGEESLLQAVRSHHLPSSSTYPSPLLQSCSCAYQAFVPSGSLRKTSSSSILSSLMLCSLFFLSSSFPWQHGNSTRMHLRLVRSSCTFLPCCSASRSMGLYLFFLLKVPSQKGMNSSEVCTNLKLHQNCSLTKKTFSPSWRN